MSIRKWVSDKVNVPKAKFELTLNSGKHFLGEPILGSAKITSEEEFDVTRVAVILTCNERVKKTRTYNTQYGTAERVLGQRRNLPHAS
jgi:hypothetical protein